ncbi:MAG: hypothetical protein R6W81_14805, partial [Bacteroidales bacterium]
CLQYLRTILVAQPVLNKYQHQAGSRKIRKAENVERGAGSGEQRAKGKGQEKVSVFRLPTSVFKKNIN